MLAVLSIVYAANIADRFVVSTVLEPIRMDLHLSDAQTALLTGVALALFYVTIGLPMAAFADRTHRRNIVAAAVAVWSVMTALCGMAHTVWGFLFARFGVGIGEAGGTPPSTSMLADTFPPPLRPAAFTIFALGAPIGAWLGSELAGVLADRYGWRMAFLALGVPGIAVAALLFLTVREPTRGRFDASATGRAGLSQGLLATARHLRAQRSALHLVAGGTIGTLWGWGLMWWTPAFLMRAHGLSVGAAGAMLGRMHLVGGMLGTLATTVAVAPRIARDSRRVVWLMAAVLSIATIPSIVAYGTSSLSVATLALWMVVPAVYFFIGPTLGLLQNVMPPTMRAQTVAILLFTANVANLIVAPQMIGSASDALAGPLGGNGASLRAALLALAPTGFWAAFHYWAAARRIRADEEMVARP